MTGASQYLLGLYIAERGETGPVPTGEVADVVGRSPSATTEVLQRLAEKGLVAYEPYRGATLTAPGEERAEDLYDSYVALSEFFRVVLELDDYEGEAMRLAGNVSPVVTDRLAATLPLEADTVADG